MQSAHNRNYSVQKMLKGETTIKSRLPFEVGLWARHKYWNWALALSSVDLYRDWITLNKNSIVNYCRKQGPDNTFCFGTTIVDS